MYMPNPADETVASLFGTLYADEANNDDKYEVIRPHGRRDWLITLTLNGAGIYRLRDREFVVKRGDVALLLPYTPQHYATLSGHRWHFYWAHFVPVHDGLNSLSLTQDEPGLGLHHIDDEEIMRRLEAAFIRMIADNRSHSRYNNNDLAHNALEEILLLISRTLTDDHSLDPRLRTTLAYMETHLHQAITVEQLAAKVALSPSRFAHLFTTQVGQSPMRYLIQLRLRQAARLLTYSGHSVQMIATMMGYESPFHFSRQFKQHYGLSPSEYRQRQNTLTE